MSGSRKKALAAFEHFDPVVKRRIEETYSKFDGQSVFQKLVQSTDTKDQITILKKLCDQVKSTFYDGKSGDRSGLEILILIYMTFSPKHTAKRILVSALQNFPPCSQDVIIDLMEELFLVQLRYLKQPKASLDNMRRGVDLITALMENFSLGEQCLKHVGASAFVYLADTLNCFMDHFRSDLSPVQRNEDMHNCLATIQSANRLLQKCSSKETFQCHTDDITKSTDIFIENIIGILQNDIFLLDCRSSCGMNLVLILRLQYGDKTIQVLLQTLFQKDFDILVPMDNYLQQLSHDTLQGSSYLCLCHGLLAMLDVSELLFEFSVGKCVLLDVFLEELLLLNERCQETGSKLLVAKTISLLTNRTCAVLREGGVGVANRLLGGGTVLQKLLQYVWTTWEDTLDVIRLTAREIFENVVALHLQAGQICKVDAVDSFLTDLVKSLLFDVSWSCKGKYGTLCCMIGHLGTSVLLELHPGIAKETLTQMREQTLACYASELYEKLYTSHKEEVMHSIHGDSQLMLLTRWQRQWLDPVLDILSGQNRTLKTHVTEYILPKILKHGIGSLDYSITKLSQVLNTKSHGSSDYECDVGRLGALVVCLRRSRALGLFKTDHSGDEEELLFGFVQVNVLKQALSCKDDQVRLDAFSLICENHHTTEPLTLQELEMVKFFIPLNLNSQIPAFRQSLLSLLKRLLSRLQDSGAVLKRQAAQVKKNSTDTMSSTHIIEYYQDFLRWLRDMLFENLFPDASFTRRTTCLAALALIAERNFTEESVPNWFSREQYQMLIGCLDDLFEENKMAALSILTASSHRCITEGSTILQDLLKKAMSFVSSTKPQDSTTAAYIFRFLLQQTNFLCILKTISKDIPTLQENEQLNEMLMQVSDNTQCNRTLLLLWKLVSILQEQILVAEGSLLKAASEQPMYPTMHCIRYLLMDLDLRKMPTQQNLQWRSVLGNLIRQCLILARVVSPVVHNSSPEGNIPYEAIGDLDSSSSPGFLDVGDDLESSELIPQYLVVCCWRSIKEVSLLLGHMTLSVPVIGCSGEYKEDQEDGSFITFEQIFDIGEFFTTQLLESKHRGAFELAYAGFVKLCEMLWRSSASALHVLPQKWLQKIIDDIKSDDPESKLCATRRSAGVPFYVQALVITEPKSTGRVSFKSSMEELLSLALGCWDETAQPSDSKVHALNILRALFKETKLAQDVTPYVADGVKAAILGFKSAVWAERNSATLLMSALMTRIFGVKRSKDENSLSRKNCQTGRTFFHQYPQLYQFLLEQLAEVTQDDGGSGRFHLHPALYPLLMILGRLFPSAMEGTDTTFSLEEFIPYILRCSKSSVMKTRLMAARALQPLVTKEKLGSLFTELMRAIPTDSAVPIIQSHLHGALLQMRELFVVVNKLGVTARSELGHMVLSLWSERSWIMKRNNICLITRKEALELASEILRFTDQKSDMNSGLFKDFYNIILSEIDDVNVYSECTPGLSEFHVAIATLALQYLYHPRNSSLWQKRTKENIVLKLLNSLYYEVRLESLSIISICLRKCSFTEEDNKMAGVWQTDELAKSLQSRNILEKLSELAMETETHDECQMKVFEVLQFHSLSKAFPWSAKENLQSPFQVMERTLEVLSVSKRDELRAEVMKFAGHLVEPLYRAATNMQQETVTEVFSCLHKALYDNSSSVQSSILQLSCAQVIKQNAINLLQDPDNILGDLAFAFWGIVVNLLQEDDLEVKDTTADILCLLDKDVTIPVQPQLALDLLVGKMVNLHGANCQNILKEWTQKRDIPASEIGERVFDRSEMNTYREETLFRKILQKYSLS